MTNSEVDEVMKQGVLEAIRILDILKGRVVHENLDAWFILYHAKGYLQMQL